MAEVDISKVTAAAKKVKLATDRIETKRIGNASYFKGPHLETWFDDHGEMLKANVDAARIQLLKEQGLNEHGQTPEQVAEHKQRAVLLAKRAEMMKEVARIDVQIATRSYSDKKAPRKKK